MVVAAMKHMDLNFVNLDKFEGVDFRRCSKKIHFLLFSMSVVYVLTTLIIEDGGENATMEHIKKKNKWDNDDYACRCLILNDSHLRIEESLRVQDNDKPKGNNIVGPSVVNDGAQQLLQDCKAGKVGNNSNGSGTNGSVDNSTNSLKGEREIECILIGYAEHSKAFRLRIHNGTENIGGSVVPEEVIEEVPKQWHQKFDESVLSNGYLLNQADKYVYRKFDETGKGVIIFLYVDNMLIFGTDQFQVDPTKDFLPSRFSMKDMGEANVILGIKIKLKSNLIGISQSYYIEKVLKKFNYFDCTPMSTPIDTSEMLMPNNGHVVSQLDYSKVIGCLMYVTTCTRPNISFDVGKLSMYTSNPSLKDKLMKAGSAMLKIIHQPVAGTATLEKAYSQMYNGNSRNLGVRHSMIHELIMNGVVSIEFVRSQQNLADHMTKGLPRDLILNSAEGMGIKSNQVVEC
nr:zinc finger, CCHC-type [Tanacetum cinerariifolium]